MSSSLNQSPILLSWGPVADVLIPKPEPNLMLCRFNCITSMADVAANLYAVISSDCSRLAGCRVSLSKHHPASLDSTLPFPCHCHHWTRVHVGHKSWEKRSSCQIGIVFPEMSLARSHHPDSNQLEAFLLKPLDNLTNKSPLDSIRLDHDESSLSLSPCFSLQLERCSNHLCFGDLCQGLLGQNRHCLFKLDLIVLVLGKSSCNKCSSQACRASQYFSCGLHCFSLVEVNQAIK